MTGWESAGAKWRSAKPLLIAVAVGLVTGPLISSYAGWQVTARTSQALVRAGIVEQQALICEGRARAEVKEPEKLDWSARGGLAKKWAVLPGVAATDSDAAHACAGMLAA
jgi:hypothetical protein